jgi:hypothetical protein
VEDEMNETMMIWSVLFGGLGVGFFSYGRKQKSLIPLLTGLALFIFPYFMLNATMLVVVGCVLLLVPYLARYF